MRCKFLAVSTLALHMGLAAQEGTNGGVIPIGTSCHPIGAYLEPFSGNTGNFSFVWDGSNEVRTVLTGLIEPELVIVVLKLGGPQSPIALPAPFGSLCVSHMGTNTFWSLPAQVSAPVFHHFPFSIGHFPILDGLPLTVQAASYGLNTGIASTTNALTGILVQEI